MTKSALQSKKRKAASRAARRTSRPSKKAAAEAAQPTRLAPIRTPIIVAEDVSVHIDGKAIVQYISFEVHREQITALIGSSGCGKTTLLRTICRSIEDDPGEIEIEGAIYYGGENILKIDDKTELRRKLCYVAQIPNLFRTSIYENVVLATRYWFRDSKNQREARAELALKRVGLWEDVKDRLGDAAHGLSAGQRQKLCLARALAIEPDVLLLDEPTANLDPISTTQFEETIHELRGSVGILIITHNMQQAARVSQQCQHMYFGQIVEQDETSVVFTNPRAERTKGYITGRWG